jgi:hypothetical protein
VATDALTIAVNALTPDRLRSLERPSISYSRSLASLSSRFRGGTVSALVVAGRLAGIHWKPVAVKTIRFADQPNLFRYKRGEKVVQRDADGYADPDWAGVVIDGAWRGDPSGGPHKATYRIKRDRGDYLEAEELALLKRFDIDAELRDEIREKIRTYALPRSMPPARGVERKETIRQLQEASPCSACGHQIRLREPGSVEYEYSPGLCRFRFHSRCNAIWREEVRRRLAPPARL